MPDNHKTRLHVLPTELACVKALLGQHMPGALAWAQLREALTESDLPWRVDVTALDDLPPNLQELVQARGVALSAPSTP